MRVFVDRRQRRQLAGSLIAAYLVSVSVVLERDPTTGLVPKPSDYLPVVIPGTLLVAIFVARAWKVRMEATPEALVVHRVAGRAVYRWDEIVRFEAVPTPTRRGWSAAVRLADGRLERLRSFVPLLRRSRLAEMESRARQLVATLAEECQADLSPAPHSGTSTRSSGAASA